MICLHCHVRVTRQKDNAVPDNHISRVYLSLIRKIILRSGLDSLLCSNLMDFLPIFSQVHT